MVESLRPLHTLLAGVPDEIGTVTLTFADLEALLGAPLPEGAWLRAWWENVPSSPQARAWLDAGWLVQWVRRQGGTAAVTFVRPVRRARPA